MTRHSQLDLWQGRRSKPYVASDRMRPENMSFGQRLIHEERKRKMQSESRVELMPHLRKGNVPNNDAPPTSPRLERSTRFDPSPPPKHVARVAEDHDGCTAADTPQPAAGDDAVAEAEYARAEQDIQERLEELIPAVLAAHDIIKDMALCYHKMLDRQPVASVQSPLDQMLTDVLEIARRGENYVGSVSHRDVNSFEKIMSFYSKGFGSEYGLKVHKHLSATGKWHQQPRDSEAYKKGLRSYVHQKSKRSKKNAA